MMFKFLFKKFQSDQICNDNIVYAKTFLILCLHHSQWALTSLSLKLTLFLKVECSSSLMVTFTVSEPQVEAICYFWSVFWWPNTILHVCMESKKSLPAHLSWKFKLCIVFLIAKTYIFYLGRPWHRSCNAITFRILETVFSLYKSTFRMNLFEQADLGMVF